MSSDRCRSPRGIAAAFAAGAVGYVRHDERIEGVERAMLKARAGERAIAPQLLRGAFTELLNPAVQPDDEGRRLLRMLTPREAEVLVRVAEGEGTRLIAAGMGIAPSTARTHVQRVLMKLGVGSRLEAAALAARTGLLARAAAHARTTRPATTEDPATAETPGSATDAPGTATDGAAPRGPDIPAQDGYARPPGWASGPGAPEGRRRGG
ncbi:hypothetical protein SCALM49S_04150 [Streptomyces californicus]